MAKRQRFHSAQSCQEQQAYCCQGSRVFSSQFRHLASPARACVISLKLRKRRCFRSGGFFNTARGVFLDYFERRSGVFEDCPQHAHRAGSSGRATGRITAAPIARSRGLAGDYVGLHALDIGRRQAPHRQTANKRLDVRLDALYPSTKVEFLMRSLASARYSHINRQPT